MTARNNMNGPGKVSNLGGKSVVSQQKIRILISIFDHDLKTHTIYIESESP